MPLILYKENRYELQQKETVLECLERNGHSVMSSCRSGICQSCLMKADSENIPAPAQKGLREAQVKQGHFLACSCTPEEDLHVTDCDDLGQITATIESIEPLGGRIMRLRLTPEQPFAYIAGQFLNLVLPENTVRSYSIASVQHVDPCLELHIALLPGGRASSWLEKDARLGGKVTLAGPQGSCCYASCSPDQPLLLLGTGTGLAPLYGVLRDALAQGHTGPIRLYHGCRVAEDVYYQKELKSLTEAHPNVHYQAGVLLPDNAGDLPVGDILQTVMSDIGDFKGWRAFLCGHPDFVKQAKRSIFMAGASMSEIFADAFLPASGSPPK
jgi:NAD(P)H-flavin reductase/ferredoxin